MSRKSLLSCGRQMHAKGVTPIGIESSIPWLQPRLHATVDADEMILPWLMVDQSSIRDTFILVLHRLSKTVENRAKKKTLVFLGTI